MFDLDSFLDDCVRAANGGDSRAEVREILQRAVHDPKGMRRVLGGSDWIGAKPLYTSEQITIINYGWGQRMKFPAHNHTMWSVAGVYSGSEVNRYYRRRGESIAESAVRELKSGEVASMGPKAIHAVENMTDRICCAVHIFGGDFFAADKSEWDLQTLVEQPYNVEANLSRFEECKARLLNNDDR